MECMDPHLLNMQVNPIYAAVHKKKKPKSNVFMSIKAVKLLPDADKFMEAHQKELDNWNERNAYEHSTPGPGDEIVRLMPLCSRKVDELKNASHKVQFLQDGKDTILTGLRHTQVAHMDTVMAAIQIMNSLNMGLAQADISSAYLHALAKP